MAWNLNEDGCTHIHVKDADMMDTTGKSGCWYRTRIELPDEDALREWARRLSVTPEKLKEAVARVGNWSDDLQFELNRCPAVR